MYKLIALDLDGTLLDSGMKISQRNKDAMLAAQAAGVNVAIATGRSYKATKSVMEPLEYGAALAINLGGVQLTDCRTGEYERIGALTNAQAHEIIDFAMENDVYVQSYKGDDIFYSCKGKYSDYYEGRVGYCGTQTDMAKETFFDPPKVLIIAEPERIKQLFAPAHARFDGRFQIMRSDEHYMEFYSLEANKGRALAQLAKKLRIKPEEVVAVGDDTIDSSMLEYAGLGAAMGNAREELKSIADIIVPSNDNDGVAYVIENFILR